MGKSVKKSVKGGITIVKAGDDLQVSQKIKNSEVDKDVADISIGEARYRAKADQIIEGSKVKSGWVWLLLAASGIIYGLIKILNS